MEQGKDSNDNQLSSTQTQPALPGIECPPAQPDVDPLKTDDLVAASRVIAESIEEALLNACTL